jgi:hypothetical protein
MVVISLRQFCCLSVETVSLFLFMSNRIRSQGTRVRNLLKEGLLRDPQDSSPSARNDTGDEKKPDDDLAIVIRHLVDVRSKD